MRTTFSRRVCLAFWFVAISAAFAQEEMVIASNEESRAAALASPDPVYSVPARRAKLSGKVEITAFVDKEGNVTETVLVVGNPVLAEMCKEAARKWKFKPFLDEKGMPAKAMAHLRFELKPPTK